MQVQSITSKISKRICSDVFDAEGGYGGRNADMAMLLVNAAQRGYEMGLSDWGKLVRINIPLQTYVDEVFFVTSLRVFLALHSQLYPNPKTYLLDSPQSYTSLTFVLYLSYTI